jgi:hypothetical protein
MSNKVIFLDIDGVLNDHTYDNMAESNTLKKKCVDNFNHLLLQTDAKIVISSAWRYLILGKHMSLLGFEAMLRTHGVACQGRLIGTTLPDETVYSRENQIREFLESLRERGKIKYAVIDDLPLELSSDVFVRTDGNVGLTMNDVEKIVKILHG